MNYYQELLNQISMRESAVDCNRCSAEWKCCTYRPFIANFLAGNAMLSFDFTPELFSDWDFLITGIAPNMKYRKHFFKKGKWGFGSDATLLCSFYDKKSGGCQIWQSRPAVCRTFFCKSTYHEAGAFYWNKAEEFSWHLEWVLLEDFLYARGWTLADVRLIKGYLDEATVTASGASGRGLPPEYRFQDLGEAKAFYSAAREHVLSLAPEYVEQILGEHGRSLYAELLAEKAKLGYVPGP